MERFASTITYKLFKGLSVNKIDSQIRIRAKKKITYVYIAKDLKDLLLPPSNNLEKLKGDRKNQYSIRVNDKYRVCFTWIEGQAENIEFVDYHK